jgi:hypothetical protein
VSTSAQSGTYYVSSQFPFNFQPTFGALPAFDVVGTAEFHFGHYGVGLGQIAHLVVGPVAVPPGVPVEANLALVDINGTNLVPPLTVTLTAGQTAALDFNADALIKAFGQRVEVRPVITPILTTLGNTVDLAPETPTFQGLLTSPATAVPGTKGLPLASACPATAEVFDHRTGRPSTSQVSGTSE